MKRHWRPRPIIRLSVAVHAAALALVLVMPRAWGWALSAVLANHAVLTLASHGLMGASVAGAALLLSAAAWANFAN